MIGIGLPHNTFILYNFNAFIETEMQKELRHRHRHRSEQYTSRDQSTTKSESNNNMSDMTVSITRVVHFKKNGEDGSSLLLFLCVLLIFIIVCAKLNCWIERRRFSRRE